MEKLIHKTLLPRSGGLATFVFPMLSLFKCLLVRLNTSQAPHAAHWWSLLQEKNGFQEAHYWAENKNNVFPIEGIVLWKRTPLFFFKICFYCEEGGCIITCMEANVQPVGAVASLLLHVVPGSQLRLSGLVACTLTHWAILATKNGGFLKFTAKTHTLVWRADILKGKDPA